MDDMFGHVPQAGELPMEETSAPVSNGPPVHTPETIRAMVKELLAELAAASESIPWTPRKLHSVRGMWRFYVEWFDDTEAADLTAQFHAHLTRLGEPLVNGPFNFAWSEFETVREIAAEKAASA